jgi:uncharacterized protein (DUF427 family)
LRRCSADLRGNFLDRLGDLEPALGQRATSGCAYKGFARCWTVEVDRDTFEDVVWSYPTPLPENVKIAGLVAFYNEKVDLIVDGERLERPKTKFS